MSSIEEKLRCLLNGKDLGDITTDLCDFSVREQTEQPTASLGFELKLGKTIIYIVACVIFNERDELLMIEEAKPRCAGQWYLPAGRMESGESITEAAARELLEETGLKGEMTTLLAVESNNGSWFRFVLTGRITGGRLKTPADADAESIQARWLADPQQVPLRSKDVLKAIDIGRAYHQQQKTGAEDTKANQPVWHNNVLPTRHPHKRNHLRLLLLCRKRSNNSMYILISKKSSPHFPTAEIHPNRSVHLTLRKFLTKIFGPDFQQPRPHGLLSVEHLASDHEVTDGICLNLLVALRPALEEMSVIGQFVWNELSAPLEETLVRILSSKHGSIPLIR